MCKSRQNFVFSNDDVKAACAEIGFGNPFDATKIDSSSGLPHALIEDDAFVVHLGRGSHQFVFGIANGYHQFEPIPDNCKYQWPLRSVGILDNFNVNERDIPYWGYNRRVIHDFLYEDITASPKIYLLEHTRLPLSYRIGNNDVNAAGLRIEIDMTSEHLGMITVFKAASGEARDFNVFQLFNPFRYYLRATENLSVSSIQCCYLVRPEDDELRMYLYEFTNPQNPGSITLIRNAEYTLGK